AAFVLTLLAFLFFGTTRPPISVSPVVVPPKTPLTTRDMVEIKDYIPPPIDDPDPDPMAKPDNGGGGQTRPTLPDEPQIIHPGVAVIPVEPPSIQPSGPISKLGPSGPFPGNGDESGIGQGRRVTTWKELDQPPRTKTQASPIYPAKEKFEGVNGSVEVEFIVDETGAVVNPRIISSTHRAFEEPTLRAVEQWRFVPGRSHGKVVSFRMRVPVLFNVND
ncbi:MAG TPA: energy transducer TonB, partial [Opitutaceae bacterium]|nr:energy transducer TonB [Opitutaceae bacterium]